MFQTATFRKEKLLEKAIEKGIINSLIIGFLFWKECLAPNFWNGPPVDSGLFVISKYPILFSQF